MAEPYKYRPDWIQLAILLVAMLGMALHEESRLSRIEQQLADADAARIELLQRLSRLEDKWDRYQATQPRYRTVP